MSSTVSSRKLRHCFVERPVLTELAETEIKQISDYFYALQLRDDEELRAEGIGDDPLYESIHKQLSEAGVEFESSFSIKKVGSGLSDRMMHKIDEETSIVLPALKEALARGNVEFIRYELNEVLQLLRINLDQNCPELRTVYKRAPSCFLTSPLSPGAPLFPQLPTGEFKKLGVKAAAAAGLTDAACSLQRSYAKITAVLLGLWVTDRGHERLARISHLPPKMHSTRNEGGFTVSLHLTGVLHRETDHYWRTS